MTNANFHVFGAVTDIRTTQLKLSTGHWVLCANYPQLDSIKVGDNVFVQCYQTNTTSHDPTRALIASKIKQIDDLPQFKAIQRELLSALDESMKSMKGLNKHDRAMVLTAIGVGAGALAAGSGFATLAGQAAVLAAEGGFNPISVTIGGALLVGGVVTSVLQAETFKELHGERIHVYNKFKRQQQAYAAFMMRFFDTTTEMDSVPLNPLTGQLLQSVRDIYGYNITNLRQWWLSTFDTYPSEYAVA